MRIYDRIEERFVRDDELVDITNETRYESLSGKPDVLIVHLVAEADHDIVLLINGWVILKEDHTDDEYHRVTECVSRIGVKTALSLGTHIESLRVHYRDFLAAGTPQGEGLVRLARSLTPSKRRPFAETAMVHDAHDRYTHDPATVREELVSAGTNLPALVSAWVCVDCAKRPE